MRWFFAATAALLLATAAQGAEDGAPAKSCPPLKQVASIPLHVWDDGRFGVPVTLGTKAGGSQDGFLLLHTAGATRSLTAKTVRELGLDIQSGAIELGTNNKKPSERYVMAPSFDFGGLHTADVRFQISPLGVVDVDEESPTAPQGNFSTDLLAKLDLDLDFPARKMGLFLQDHCDGDVVYWPAPGVAVVPFTLNASNHIIISVTIDGKTFDARFNTAAPFSSMAKSIAMADLDVDMSAPDVVAVKRPGYNRQLYERRFAALSLGDVTVKNVKMTIDPAMAAPRGSTGTHIKHEPVGVPPVTIGLDVLRRLHIYMALKEKKLYITPGTKPVAADK